MSSDANLSWQPDALVDRINTYLDQLLQPTASLPAGQQHLFDAMRYAVLGSGKRIRPLSVYAAGHLVQANPNALDAAAAAVELVHCYSLVHDDLPAMDDDDLRRGRPTLHRQYDEATAILSRRRIAVTRI